MSYRVPALMVAVLAGSLASGFSSGCVGEETRAPGPNPLNTAEDGGPTVDGSRDEEPAPRGDGAACSYRAEVLADAPLHYFRFRSASAGLVDEVATSDAGALVGASVAGPGAVTCEMDDALSVTAANGSAAELYGPDYEFVAKKPFSIEFWFAPGVQTFRYARLFSHEELVAANTRTGYAIIYDVAGGSGAIYFGRYDGIQGDANAEDEARVTLNTLPAANQYVHVVGSFDGTTLKLYINGDLVGQRAARFDLPRSSARTLVGARPMLGTELGSPFTGRIDEVAVYGSALGDARVRAHFAAAH